VEDILCKFLPLSIVAKWYKIGGFSTNKASWAWRRQ